MTLQTSRALHASIVANCDLITDKELVTLIAGRTCSLMHDLRQAADNDNDSQYKALRASLASLDAVVNAHVVIMQTLNTSLKGA